jgi:hypothetical protein
MKYPKRNITVKASQISKAIKQAKQLCPHDWEAELLEILLIPIVTRRWRYVNDRFPNVTIKRHVGFPYVRGNVDPRTVEDWLIYAGYEFDYGGSGYCWNRARSDHYGHSPGTAWDGVRRETYHSFVETLRMCYYCAIEGTEINYRLEVNLRDYRVCFINDLEA